MGNVSFSTLTKYTRWCDGDIYVCRKSNGYFYCMHCSLMDDMHDAVFKRRTDILSHMIQHKNEGHNVPDLAFALLQIEKNKFGEEGYVEENDNGGKACNPS